MKTFDTICAQGDVLARKVEPRETAPPDVQLLLYCPERHFTNRERIEVGEMINTRGGTSHPWATHWAPIPSGPSADEIAAALAREDEAEHHYRMAEEEYHREMDATHR